MRQALSVITATGIALVGIAPFAKAETWYLIPMAAEHNKAVHMVIPTSTQEECEVGGAQFVKASKGGKFDQEGVGLYDLDFTYLCIKGK